MSDDETRRRAEKVAYLIMMGFVTIVIGAVIVILIWAGVRVADAMPDGPPAYGYDCDSAYVLREANC